MRPLTALALALVVAVAGCPVVQAGPILETDDSEPRTYKGITEGDIITGELSYYCPCAKCNGSDHAGETASGLEIYKDMPDPLIVGCNWLPLGAIVEVNGIKYTVADRGGSGLDRVGRLDVFEAQGHTKALERGRVRDIEVRVVGLP